MKTSGFVQNIRDTSSGNNRINYISAKKSLLELREIMKNYVK